MEKLAEGIRTNLILINLKLLRIEYEDNESLLKAAEYAGSFFKKKKIYKNLKIKLTFIKRKMFRNFRLY